MKKLLRFSVACLSIASLHAMEMPSAQLQIPWEREDSSKSYLTKLAKLEPAVLGNIISFILEPDLEAFQKNETEELLSVPDTTPAEEKFFINAHITRMVFYKNLIKVITKLNDLLTLCEAESLLKNQYAHSLLFDRLQRSFLAKAQQVSRDHYNTFCKMVNAVNSAAEGDDFLQFFIKKIEEIKKIHPWFICTTDEFENLIKNDLDKYKDLFGLVQFEQDLNRILQTGKQIPDSALQKYVNFFYENDNSQVLANFACLLDKLCDGIGKVIPCGFYQIDPLFINSHLLTLKAFEQIKNFLNECTAPTEVIALLLSAAKTGNKDLAALAIQKGAFNYLNDPKIFQAFSCRAMNKIRHYYPILEDLYTPQCPKIATAEEFLEYALQTAQKNNQNELSTFLKNSTVDSTYFKPFKEIHPSVSIQQYKAVQQPENSSRSSGYYALINGLTLYHCLADNQTVNDETILSKPDEYQQSEVSDMRSHIGRVRALYGLPLLINMLYDILAQSIKGSKKIGDLGYSLETTPLKELGRDAGKILKHLAESSAAYLFARLEADKKNMAHPNAYGRHIELHFDSDTMTNLVKDACHSLEKSNLLHSLSVDECVSWFNFSPCSFKIEYKENQNMICSTSMSGGETKQYTRKYSKYKPVSLSGIIEAAKPVVVPAYGIRKQIIHDCIKKNGMDKEVTPDCIESLARATNEWNKEMIQAMIDSAIKVRDMKPEEIMHWGESPLIFDETNSMPVYWDDSTLKTHLDKHLYAQWKKYEADRLRCIENQNRIDSSLPTDWLSFNELYYLANKFEKGISTFYVSDSNLLTSAEEFQKIIDALHKNKKALVLIESNNHWISCVLSKNAKDKIHLAIADSKNCDRRYDRCILHVMKLLRSWYASQVCK